MAGFRLSVDRSRSWDQALSRFQNASDTVHKRQILALKRAALIAEGAIKKGLASGAPGGQTLKPLDPLTILLRRGQSDRPLLDSGSLLGSITTSVDEENLTAFVGVHRTARSSDGRLLMNIAIIHEFGTKPFVITVTPAMRALFISLHIRTNGAIQPLRADTTEIHHPGIPARPFIAPTLAAIGPRISQEIQAVIENEGGLI